MMTEEIAPLRNQINSILERNRYLEEHNLQLRQEIRLLRNQIQSLKERDSDEKAMAVRKLHASSVASNCSSKEKHIFTDNYNSSCKQKVSMLELKGKEPRVPKPPPRPKQMQATQNAKKDNLPAPPPPPPPLSSKLQGCGALNAVQRVPEVVELYRMLTRREGKIDAKTGSVGIPVAMNSREMIGEIENRSAYVLAVTFTLLCFFCQIDTSLIENLLSFFLLQCSKLLTSVS
jgi:hypothetical protein